MPHAGCRMPDSGCQPRRGVMFVERDESPTLPAPDRNVYRGPGNHFPALSETRCLRGSEGAMGRGSVWTRERKSERATWRRCDGARERLDDGATERRGESATWRWGDGDTVVQSGRSEIMTQDARHRTQGTGLRGQSAPLRAQGSGHRVTMKFICAYPRNPHEHISAKGLQSAFQPFNPSTLQLFTFQHFKDLSPAPHAPCRMPHTAHRTPDS